MNKVSCWFCDRLRSLVLTLCGPEERKVSREVIDGFVHIPEEVDEAVEHQKDEAEHLVAGLHAIAGAADPLRELVFRISGRKR